MNLTPDQERLFRVLRAALIHALGAVEDVLGIPRSIPPRKERKREPDSIGRSEQEWYTKTDN